MAAKKKPPRKRVKCGTNAGYQAHVQAGEKPCEECKKAHSEYFLAYRAKRREGKPTRVPVAEKRKRDEARGAEIEALAHGAPAEGVGKSPENAPEQGVKAPAGYDPDRPKFLRARGRVLWEEVHKAYEVDAVSRELVVEACRLADRCERMAAALSSKKTLWFELGEPSDLDSGGVEVQIVVNSMIGEARASQAALATTLAKIGALPKIKPKEDQRVNVLDQLAERRKARIAGAQESKEEAK